MGRPPRLRHPGTRLSQHRAIANPALCVAVFSRKQFKRKAFLSILRSISMQREKTINVQMHNIKPALSEPNQPQAIQNKRFASQISINSIPCKKRAKHAQMRTQN